MLPGTVRHLRTIATQRSRFSHRPTINEEVQEAVMRSVTLELDPFARDSVRDQLIRGELSLTELLRRAALYYLAERRCGRPSTSVPRFARGERPASIDAARLELDLDLDPAAWRALEEAATEEVAGDVSRLLAHATMLFLADLDSGRVARRLAESDA
jgi:hypothetical protein